MNLLIYGFILFTESGGRKLNENKALTSKKARLVSNTGFSWKSQFAVAEAFACISGQLLKTCPTYRFFFFKKRIFFEGMVAFG